MKIGEKMQDRASELLAKCLNITCERRSQYGGDVFEGTAKIANAMFQRDYGTEDVHIIMFAMKLARYGFQIDLPRGQQNEHTIIDSAIDAAVYLQLMEAAREVLHEQSQGEVSPT